MSGDKTKWPAWPLPRSVSGLDDNGRLTADAADAIAAAATDYATVIRDDHGFPDGIMELAAVVLNGFDTYWRSVRRAFRAGVPKQVLQRDWVEEDIGLGPDAYSRSTEKARRIWNRAFGRVMPRRRDPA